jgi:hypothetical protein
MAPSFSGFVQSACFPDVHDRFGVEKISIGCGQSVFMFISIPLSYINGPALPERLIRDAILPFPEVKSICVNMIWCGKIPQGRLRKWSRKDQD